MAVSLNRLYHDCFSYFLLALAGSRLDVICYSMCGILKYIEIHVLLLFWRSLVVYNSSSSVFMRKWKLPWVADRDGVGQIGWHRVASRSRSPRVLLACHHDQFNSMISLMIVSKGSSSSWEYIAPNSKFIVFWGLNSFAYKTRIMQTTGNLQSTLFSIYTYAMTAFFLYCDINTIKRK
jgi:hypothetical protein